MREECINAHATASEHDTHDDKTYVTSLIPQSRAVSCSRGTPCSVIKESMILHHERYHDMLEKCNIRVIIMTTRRGRGDEIS